MMLTVDILRNAGACAEGIKDFERFFPNGLSSEWWTKENQIRLIKKTRLRKYIGWAYQEGVLSLYSMYNADLRNADLRNANLYNANLYNADLRNADLRNADLRNANLYNANLYNANLYNADLRNADLRNADLIDHDIELLRSRGAVL